MNTEMMMFSSASDEWETPPELFAKLDAEFHFDLDVCATVQNTKAACFYDKEADGLNRPWAPNTCWMNPPYGTKIGKWMAKAYLESAGGGCTVVCLVPARTDTKWWHDYVIGKEAEVRFLKGRVKFLKAGAGPNDKRQPAPFPSAIVIYRPGNVDAVPTL